MRKIIQITYLIYDDDGGVESLPIVLCDDGTIWRKVYTGWQQDVDFIDFPYEDKPEKV